MTVEVTATDNGGLSVAQAFTIDVTDVNEVPEAISLGASAVAENAPGAVIGALDVSDPDVGDVHAFGVSAIASNEVVDGELKLREGVALDAEEGPVTVEVTATDNGGLSAAQAFTIDVTDVNEVPEAISLGASAVAENAPGAVIGALGVSDPDVGDVHAFGVSDDRFEVVDGELKLREGVALEAEEGPVTVEVTATDNGGLSVAQAFTIDVAESPDVSLRTGFEAKYFDVDRRLSALDDIDWSAEPSHQEVIERIDYANGRGSFWEGGSTDTFGVQVTGTFQVQQSGSFAFSLGADDGAALWVDGKEVIANDGLHGFRTRAGEIDLEPGAHVFEVRYFENYGNAGLRLEIEGPGTDGPQFLEPTDADALKTWDCMPVHLSIDTDVPDSLAGHTLSQFIDGLPTGTLVSAGDRTAIVDETGNIEVTDWDVGSVSVAPPLGYSGEIDAGLRTANKDPYGTVTEATIPIRIDVEELPQSLAPDVEIEHGFR